MKRSRAKKFDVVVVGAGGAGMNVAQLLAKKGLHVALIERKASPLTVSFHTLGSFINLKRHELSKKVIAQPITSLVIQSKHITVRKPGKVAILNKSQLHKELLEKVHKSAVTTIFGTVITRISQDKSCNVTAVIDSNGNEYKATVFVDATGPAGLISKKLGLQDKQIRFATGVEYNSKYLGDPHAAYLLIGKHYQGGYGWIFPLGKKRAIVGYGSFEPKVQAELRKRLDAMYALPNLDGLIINDDTKVYGGTIPVTDVRTKFSMGNVTCIGDSVSQVNPVVGEGYRFVLEAGRIAAPHIYKAVTTKDITKLQGYDEEWNDIFQDSYRRSRKLQQLADFVSKSNSLTDLCVLFFGTKKPETAARLIGGTPTRRDIYLP